MSTTSKTLQEALRHYIEQPSPEAVKSLKRHLRRRTVPVAYRLRRTGRVTEYLTWDPEKQKIQHHSMRDL